LVEGASVALCFRGCEQTLRPAGGLGRELSGALMERSRGGQASACLRAIGRALKLAGHILIRLRRGVRSMPRVSIGIDLRIGGFPQRPVRILALPDRRGAISRRAHKWMAKTYVYAEFQQARVGRRCCSVNAESEALSSSPDEHRFPGRIGRRELHESPGLGRKGVKL